MSYLSARFFDWVQGAAFYHDAHQQAVALLPTGSGRSWLDIGCGPGLLAHLAAQRGYTAMGVDPDAAMLQRARRHTPSRSTAQFQQGDLAAAMAMPPADVVSAASLLFVLPDPSTALQQLWRCVRPGGHLLVVETSRTMTPAHARAVRHLLPASRRLALHFWARARNGNAVDARCFAAVPAQSSQCTPLLHGMLHAWVLHKAR